MVTSIDVARLAGVSQPTVSRALRDSPRVTAETKRRVREAAAALGYSPNAIGRALAMGRSTRVALVVTDLQNHFYNHVIPPLHEYLESRGHELVLLTETSESAEVAERIVANRLCGAILSTTTVGSRLPGRLQEKHVPFVFFNRVAPGVEADSVTVDPAPGLAELVDEIVRLGHRRVGAVFGPQSTSTGEARETVLRDLLDERDLPLRRAHVRHGPFDTGTGLAAARELLTREDAPSVLVCANDDVAVGALNAARELGLDVPGDVSVVGFDDLPSSAWPIVDLTTIAYDLRSMACEAGRLVIARADEDAPEEVERVTFPTRLVRRGSLGRAPRA